jgi:hypothetical protein
MYALAELRRIVLALMFVLSFPICHDPLLQTADLSPHSGPHLALSRAACRLDFKQQAHPSSLFVGLFVVNHVFDSLRNHLHHTQYVSKLEDILSFHVRQARLTADELTVIWESQVSPKLSSLSHHQMGKGKAIENNVLDLLGKLAVSFEHEQMEQLFVCFQRSWGGSMSNMERLLAFLCRLAEDDGDGKMALKVLDRLWAIVHDPATPIDIVNVCV